jgi:hypothetical protein
LSIFPVAFDNVVTAAARAVAFAEADEARLLKQLLLLLLKTFVSKIGEFKGKTVLFLKNSHRQNLQVKGQDNFLSKTYISFHKNREQIQDKG